MQRDILDSVWFTSITHSGCIGIVLCHNSVDELRAYIGRGDGMDEREDAERIVDFGAPFPLAAAAVLMPGAYARATESTSSGS